MAHRENSKQEGNKELEICNLGPGILEVEPGRSEASFFISWHNKFNLSSNLQLIRLMNSYAKSFSRFCCSKHYLLTFDPKESYKESIVL